MYTYQIVSVGKMWHIVDRSNSRKVVGFSATNAGAIEKAKNLEAKMRTALSSMIEQRKAELANSLKAMKAA